MDQPLPVVDAVLLSWDKNLGYAKKLVADVPADRMVYQPAANMNHPAWVLCHLNAYHDVIVSLVRGQRFDDPKDHRFGMKSKPVADLNQYPSRADLIDAFARGHGLVAAALQSAGPDVWTRATELERWKPVLPTVGQALVYLMILHESTHLGQLSAWRRVQGMPGV